ncbi:hypothetical protein LABALGNA3A7_09430 [Dellaglioa algida]|nr:hypothetical protein LABALGNA3A7_09430 [Dellaglioa algida]
MNRRQKNKQRFQISNSNEESRSYKGTNEHLEIRIIAGKEHASIAMIEPGRTRYLVVNREV